MSESAENTAHGTGTGGGYWRALSGRERIGWVIYDWANSAFVLCVITVIGSAYFLGTFESAATTAGDLQVGPSPAMRLGGIAVTAEAAWSLLVGFSAFIVAFSSPFLGALADAGGGRKRFMQVYCVLGVLATLGLWLSLPWWAIALLILLGNIGFEGGNVFYNAYLPDIASPGEQDQLSSMGYAFGYIGGVIVLILSLVMFVPPQGDIHNAFLLVGVWWGGWALLTFAWLPSVPARRAPGGGSTPGHAWRELRTTVKNIAQTPQAALFLLAFLLYNDGVATLISNVTPFALQNMYLDAARTERIALPQLITAIIIVQVVAFPGSLFCGWLATRFGEKRALYFTLAVFTCVVSYGQVAYVVTELYLMAALIGVVLGGAQAISRSLFASLIPEGKNAEFFAFFALSSKFSAMLGPLVYGGLLLLTGDTRLSLLSLTLFFALGAFVLSRVDVSAGRVQAGRAG